MNLSEILFIETRLSEIEEELENEITESAKDALYLECYRLEDRLDKIYGDKEKIHAIGDEDD